MKYEKKDRSIAPLITGARATTSIACLFPRQVPCVHGLSSERKSKSFTQRLDRECLYGTTKMSAAHLAYVRNRIRIRIHICARLFPSMCGEKCCALQNTKCVLVIWQVCVISPKMFRWRNGATAQCLSYFYLCSNVLVQHFDGYSSFFACNSSTTSSCLYWRR